MFPRCTEYWGHLSTCQKSYVISRKNMNSLIFDHKLQTPSSRICLPFGRPCWLFVASGCPLVPLRTSSFLFYSTLLFSFLCLNIFCDKYNSILLCFFCSALLCSILHYSSLFYSFQSYSHRLYCILLSSTCFSFFILYVLLFYANLPLSSPFYSVVFSSTFFLSTPVKPVLV